jgi:hypothetical protein
MFRLDEDKEQHWLEVLKQWQVSGLNQAEFCRQQGHEYKSFCRWRRILIKRQLIPGEFRSVQRTVKPKLVPIEINSAFEPATKSGWLEISTPSGYAVRIP